MLLEQFLSITTIIISIIVLFILGYTHTESCFLLIYHVSLSLWHVNISCPLKAPQIYNPVSCVFLPVCPIFFLVFNWQNSGPQTVSGTPSPRCFFFLPVLKVFNKKNSVLWCLGDLWGNSNWLQTRTESWEFQNSSFPCSCVTWQRRYSM